MNIEHKVIEIIAEQAVLEVSDVSESSTLVDLGIDSLGLVESIFAIEEEFVEILDSSVAITTKSREPSWISAGKSIVAHHLKPSYRQHWHLDYIKHGLQPIEIWTTTDLVKREHD